MSLNLQEVIIRDAVINDFPDIIKIYNQAVLTGISTADTKTIQLEDRLEWFKQFDPQKRPLWTVLYRNQIIAFTYLSSFYGGRPAYDKTAEHSTYIDKNFHAQGLGSFLKDKMIKACPSLGVENLLTMYFDHNIASKKLNEKFGFTEVGHLENIATIHGKTHGLKIAILNIPPSPKN